ncbi:spermidine putrescine ABC superfamily ATP binding cassette transporter, membrane protein [Weissella halotolerans DSM 20190]|uniref:Spermidine putrescine ABC superfamily ATP binding cassette transporter, membrane protein n=2 Tax=Weissella halotolerans TaxID=1615 RepID=A0A0R2G1J7_9LACO|nr:spermidine putrescine ABC superfamily ATP binding cassette transporter, membrane protein [Weissella halotolerans DSM 20190]
MYLPIAYLIIYSFNRGATMTAFTGFSWQHYLDMFNDLRLMQILVNTLIIALLSALLATIIGTFGALLIYQMKRTGIKNIFLSLNNILLVSPDVIIGASFLILFTMVGFQLGFGSVLMAHIAFSIPIVVLMVLPRFHDMDTTLIDAAYDLGANRWQVLSRVILPYAWPGILAGFFMAITYSLDDFAVTFFVTGNGFSTLSVEIYSRARQGVDLSINALSALLFVLSLMLVVVYYFIATGVATRSSKKAGHGQLKVVDPQ